MINLGVTKAIAAGRTYSTRCVDLVKRSMVIDMLSPVTLNLSEANWSRTLSDAEIEEYKQSGLTAIHQAAGFGGPEPFTAGLTWFAAWNGFVARNSEIFIGVGGVRDLERAKSSGKVAVIMGAQNSEHFRTPADVKFFHGLGQRVSLLTYNSQNRIGSGSTEREDGGVSEFGIAVIKAMNECGMLVDTAHCNDRTTLDGIEFSAKPIAITHADCRAINPANPRTKTDEAIRKLAAKGGVMGISGVRMFVSAQEPTTIDNIVDHIDHVVKLVGIEHVGVGSDADLHGYDALPASILDRMKASEGPKYQFRDKVDIEGFNHPQKMFDLTEVLIRRGYTDSQIEMILGGNWRRLLSEVWLS